MKRTKMLLSLVLAFLLAISPLTANALYETGDKVAAYTIKASESHVLGDGLTYNEYTFDDAKGTEQICFTMEFNPKESDFRSYVYHKSASEGYTIADDAAAAYAEGLEVYAAINGDFFSMDSSTYGTPIGLYATEGKLMASSVGLKDPNLVIAEDGTADIVDSKLSYALTINGKAYNQLATVNKKVTVSANNIYYYDGDIGTASPVSTATSCKELVCTITNGTLGVGKTLEGTVSAINTQGGSAIGENQFVLTVGSNVDISGVAVGSAVSLAIDETVEASKEAMRNAAHIISCKFVLVKDGVDQLKAGNITDSNMANLYAQRCVYGIKPDGSIVYLVCDGRRNTAGGPNGLTFEQLIEIMTEYGCTDVINFDGGGSTAVILSEGDGKFNYEFIGEGDGRRVANSILIVRDPNAEAKPEKTYTPITDKAGTELRNVALNKSYTVSQNGIMTPKYMTSLMGDKYCVKMTNGRYREDSSSEERHSTVFLGNNFNVTYVLDLEKQRDDIRSVVIKNVVQSGNYNFKANNVIVYVSDDGMTWNYSVDYDIEKIKTEMSGVSDYVCTFKESKAGRYVKIVLGSPSTSLRFDEIEVYGMVDETEPKEELLPEDPATLPADEPTADNENVALGATYTMTCDGAAIADYNASTEPRYYNQGTKETTPGKLTNGKIGTSGNYFDGATLAVRAGAGSVIEVLIDLGEVKSDIEFVQILNMINNGASFGHVDTATVSYSLDGAEYTSADARESLTTKTGTQYYSLTLQFNQVFSARYVKVSFTCSKFLIGFGEVTVLSAVKYTLGDVNEDGEVNNIDAATILKYDAGLIDETAAMAAAGDVNKDGEVNNIDAAMILKYDAGIIDSL